MNTSTAEPRLYKTLTSGEADNFIRDGYLLVKEAFPRELAERIVELIWSFAPMDPSDRSTWTKARYTVQKTFVNDLTHQLHTRRVHDAMDDLLGEGRYRLEKQLGYSLINLPGFESPPWRAMGWHVDGTHFHHHLDSREQGLVGLFLHTDILPEGGGTAIRPGSHRVVAGILQQAEPDGLNSRDLIQQSAAATENLAGVEVIGRAGDMVLMHPFTVHGSSTNCSDRIRIASNICVPLHEKMHLHRTDPAEYSPVERAIVESIRS